MMTDVAIPLLTRDARDLPRAFWNHHGIAVVEIFGTHRVEWRTVHDIDVNTAAEEVRIRTGYRTLDVGTGTLYGLFGRGDRSLEQLANTLRYARDRARADPAAALPPQAVAGRMPELPVVRPPVGLFVQWAVYTVVTSALLTVYA